MANKLMFMYDKKRANVSATLDKDEDFGGKKTDARTGTCIVSLGRKDYMALWTETP